MEWVTTAEPRRECWRRLLEYTNEDVTIDRIETIHGSAPRHRANRKKQAAQLRTTLLQAKEYFDAATESSLITSPTHLYYGMTSLASAAMLLLGDGRHSLDYLRNDPSNRRHGLAFALSASAADARMGLNLLQSARVTAQEKGHFANWYSLLPSDVPVYTRATVAQPGGFSRIFNLPLQSEHFHSIDQVVNRSRTLLEQIAGLPDCFEDLVRFGVPLPASRASIDVNVLDAATQWMFLIHSCQNNEMLDSILNSFRLSSGGWHSMDLLSSTDNSAVVRYRRSETCTSLANFPNSRLRLDGQIIVYGIDFSLPEYGDAYCVAFGLSMLARYFPDIWVSSLESHCRSAKLVESMVRTYELKAPALALGMLTGQPHVFSTTTAPSL